MKLVSLMMCLIFLFVSVENKVRLNDSSGRSLKCHGLYLKDCSSKCDGIQNIESCRVVGSDYECNCVY
jgi:hypothetical protein